MPTTEAILSRSVPTAPPFVVPRGAQPACHNNKRLHPDAWFPDMGGSYSHARRVCAACPLQRECAEWAIASEQRFGMWGGLTPEQLRQIRECRNGWCNHQKHWRTA